MKVIWFIIIAIGVVGLIVGLILFKGGFGSAQETKTTPIQASGPLEKDILDRSQGIVWKNIAHEQHLLIDGSYYTFIGDGLNYWTGIDWERATSEIEISTEAGIAFEINKRAQQLKFASDSSSDWVISTKLSGETGEGNELKYKLIAYGYWDKETNEIQIIEYASDKSMAVLSSTESKSLLTSDTIGGTSIKYENYFTDADLEFVFDNGALERNLIFNKKPILPLTAFENPELILLTEVDTISYTGIISIGDEKEVYDYSSLSASKLGGDKQISFSDIGGEQYLSPSVSFDNNMVEQKAEQFMFKFNNKNYIIDTINLNYFNNAEFPVTIDPTDKTGTISLANCNDPTNNRELWSYDTPPSPATEDITILGTVTISGIELQVDKGIIVTFNAAVTNSLGITISGVGAFLDVNGEINNRTIFTSNKETGKINNWGLINIGTGTSYGNTHIESADFLYGRKMLFYTGTYGNTSVPTLYNVRFFNFIGNISQANGWTLHAYQGADVYAKNIMIGFNGTQKIGFPLAYIQGTGSNFYCQSCTFDCINRTYAGIWTNVGGEACAGISINDSIFANCSIGLDWNPAGANPLVFDNNGYYNNTKNFEGDADTHEHNQTIGNPFSSAYSPFNNDIRKYHLIQAFSQFIDTGTITASVAGLSENFGTNVDEITEDIGTLDLGYHYYASGAGFTCAPPATGNWYCNQTCNLDAANYNIIDGDVYAKNNCTINMTHGANLSWSGTGSHIFIDRGGNITLKKGCAINNNTV